MSPRRRTFLSLVFACIFISIIVDDTVRCRKAQILQTWWVVFFNLFILISHFTCISTNVICCITYTLCKKIYIGETGKRLADRFCEHLKKKQICVQTSRVPILIFLITPTTTWLFAGYPYTTERRKATKFWNKNSFFNWVHSPHMELMNTSHSTNLFANSCDHNSTNGKASLHSHITPHISSIRSDEGLTLKTLAF